MRAHNEADGKEEQSSVLLLIIYINAFTSSEFVMRASCSSYFLNL